MHLGTQGHLNAGFAHPKQLFNNVFKPPFNPSKRDVRVNIPELATKKSREEYIDIEIPHAVMKTLRAPIQQNIFRYLFNEQKRAPIVEARDGTFAVECSYTMEQWVDHATDDCHITFARLRK